MRSRETWIQVRSAIFSTSIAETDTVEYLVGREPTEYLPGTVIEPVFDLCELVVGDGPQVGSFGQVLPHQPVKVLVGASLPR